MKYDIDVLEPIKYGIDVLEPIKYGIDVAHKTSVFTAQWRYWYVTKVNGMGSHT